MDADEEERNQYCQRVSEMCEQIEAHALEVSNRYVKCGDLQAAARILKRSSRLTDSLSQSVFDLFS